jgi:hypothetical protein
MERESRIEDCNLLFKHLIDNNMLLIDDLFLDVFCYFIVKKGLKITDRFMFNPYGGDGFIFMWYSECSFKNDEPEKIKMSDSEFVNELKKII